ncbi:MAG: glycosyltransferase [Thermodesulfobacteriota bacterium]
MNILLGVHQFFPKYKTGTEVLTLELARGLKARGHEVNILSGSPETELKRAEKCWLSQEEYAGFPVYRMYYRVSKIGDYIYHHLSAPDRIVLIKRLIQNLNPNVIHFNHLMGFSGQVIPEIKKMGIPVFFTPTDFWTMCPATTLLRPNEGKVCKNNLDPINCISCITGVTGLISKIMLKISLIPMVRRIGKMKSLQALNVRLGNMVKYLNEADGIFPATKFLADLLIRSGVDNRRIRIIPYGIDIGPLPEKKPKKKLFSKKNPLIVGFIGSLSKAKGLHVLIEALSLLGDQSPWVKLYIYSKIDNSNRYYRKLQEKAQLVKSKVLFKGTFPHEEIGKILKGLDVLVVPSLWYESSPLVLLSALRAGTPVLVSRLEGMTELIEEGKNGFSFEAGDADGLSRIIKMILEDSNFLLDVERRGARNERTSSVYAQEMEQEYFKGLETYRER